MIEEIQRIQEAGVKRADELKRKEASGKKATVTNKSKRRVSFADDPIQDSIEPKQDLNLNMSLSDSAEIAFCGISMKQAREFLKNMGLFKLMEKDLKKVNDKTICDSLKKVFPSFVFRLTNVLGSGEFGSVFSSRGPNNEKLAIKAMLNGQDNTLNSVKKELDMGFIFNGLGLAPEMLGFETKKFITNKKSVTLHFISMGRVDSTVQDYLKEERTLNEIEDIMDKIFDIIVILKENDLNHGDLHIGNIGLNFKDGKFEIKLIDYGFSMTREFVELDILQLIRVTHFTVKNPNRDIVDRIVRTKAKDMFGLEYPEFQTIGTNDIDGKTLDKIEKIQDDFRATI